MRASAAGAVQRWVWATAPYYHLDPLHFLDAQLPRGRLIKTAPDDVRGLAAYGFSKANRVVVERIHLTSLKRRHYSTFYSELEDRIVGYHSHYDPTQGCINCAQLLFSDQRPAMYQQWAKGGYVSRAYVSADGKIRSVMEVFKEASEPQQRMSRELRYRR